MKKLAALLIFISFQLLSFAIIPADTVVNKDIYTIQIYNQGWELSNPIIELGTDEKIEVSFDDLLAKHKDYWYKIVHCNSAWEPEDLSYTDYMDGFWHNQVRNSVQSTNTVVPYIHYSFTLPNEDVNIKISGNYQLIVFEDDDESKIAFSKKIYVTEKQVLSKFSVSRPQFPRYMQRYQQFMLEVQPLVSNFVDLKEEISVQVVQNFDFSTCKKAYLAYLDNGNTLIYNDPDSNLFSGGNEFRNFDTKSIKYQSPRIKNISYGQNSYLVKLHPDELRGKKMYFSDEDINGKFFIENSIGRDKNSDADYFMVEFSLPSDFLDEGDVYIRGALTDWNIDYTSKMKYNFETRAYEKNILLKQGYYNYSYAFKSNFTGEELPGFIEGQHYETENDYAALVYYKSFSARYERLIGVAYANSVKKENRKQIRK